MSDIELSFRGVGEDGLERFVEMFRLCFNLDFDTSYFRWKYLENPAGRVVAFEALDGEQPAGFYGVIPELYVIDGRVTKVYQSMDTATHPDYQRRGLFVKLATMTYEHIARTEGALDIIGFPSPQSFPGFVNRLGWKAIHTIPYIFTHRALTGLRRRSPALDFEVATTGADLAPFLARRQPRQPVSKHLSPEILDWRVARHPLHRHVMVVIFRQKRPVGFCVYRVESAKAVCIEWLEFGDDEAYRLYTQGLVAYLFEVTRSRYLYTWEPTSPLLRQGYHAAGFIRNRWSRGPFTGSLPYIVYSNHAGDRSRWFDASCHDLQPLAHD